MEEKEGQLPPASCYHVKGAVPGEFLPLRADRNSDSIITTLVNLVLEKTSQIYKGGESLEKVWAVLTALTQLLPHITAVLLD